MPDRVCPKCKTSLRPHDYFFCSFCGLKLPQELIYDKVPIRRHLLNTSEHTKSTFSDNISVFWNLKTYYIFFLFVFIGLVFYGITQTGILEFAKYELLKNNSTIKLPDQIVSQSHDLVSTVAALSGDFKTNDFVNMIPESVSIYIEGWDIGFVSKYLTSQESLSLLFKRSDLLLEQNYVTFYYENYWTFVFAPKDLEITRELLEDFSDSYWKFKVVNGFLVFSSNESIFSKMEIVLSGIEPNLGQNPDFARLNNQLSPNGKFKLIRLSDFSNDVIKNSLGGLDQEFISQINEVLNNELKGIVIK